MAENVVLRISAEDAGGQALLRQLTAGLERAATAEGTAAAQATALGSASARAAQDLTKMEQALRRATAAGASASNPIPTLGRRQLGPATPEVAAFATRTAAFKAETEQIAAHAAEAKRATDADERFRKASDDSAQALGRKSTAAKTAAQSLQGMQATLSQLVVVLGAFRVTQFVGQAIDAADALDKVAERSGATVETLSVLATLPDIADVGGIEGIGNALKFLAKAAEEAKKGAGDTAEIFRRLGISAAELENLDIDQLFLRVADAQAQFDTDSEKSTAILKLFGRSGSELQGMLNSLADGGFERARAAAEQLGLVISSDTARAAKEFNDSLTTLNVTARAVALQFAGPFLGNVTAFFQGIAGVVGALPAELKALAGGMIVAAAASTILASGIAVLSVAFKVASFAIPVFRIISAVALVIGAIAALATWYRRLHADARDANDEVGRTGAPGSGDQKRSLGTIDPEQVKAAAAARLQAQREEAQQLLALQQEALRATQDETEDAYQRGLLALEQYIGTRRELIEQGIAEEQAALRSELAALQRSPLAENTEAARIQRVTEVRQLEHQIELVKVRGGRQLEELDRERLRISKQLLDRENAFRNTIARARGDELSVDLFEAAKQKLEFEKVLRDQGAPADIATREAAKLNQLLVDRAAFADKERVVERELADLRREALAIQERARTGQISEAAATQLIAEAEARRLPTVRGTAEAMRVLAERIGDPALKERVADLTASFAAMGRTVSRVAVMIANLGTDIRESFRRGIATFLGEGIASVFERDESAVDSLRAQLQNTRRELDELLKRGGAQEDPTAVVNLQNEIIRLNAELEQAKDELPTLFTVALEAAQSVVEEIQRMIAEIAATALVDRLASVFGGGQRDAAARTAAAAGALGAAGGTVVTGATQMQNAAGELALAGGIVLVAARELQAAAAALAIAGAGSGATSAAIDAVSKFIGRPLAQGGLVRGPGTSTSDSIQARLSTGEFVVRAAAVREWGVEFLEAVNRGVRLPAFRAPDRLPRFAEGGLVSASAGSGASVSGEIGVRVDLSPDLVFRELNTSRGVEAVADIVASNRGLFRAILMPG